ncbi:MAG: radical SAM protein [Elusimicrobia bacterium]|nr:radical SAM protein [Elusimicrobiota bacterium]
MRVVFLDPPSPPGFVSFKDAHGGLGEFCHSSRLKLPTLDLHHCAAWALAEGAEVSVIDSVLMDHRPEEAVAAVRAAKPDLLAVRTASGSMPHDLDVALRAKRATGATLVFFGPQAAVEKTTLLAAGADGVVLGDAPPAFASLARDGRLDAAPSRLADPDSLPVPRWDLVDHKRYSYLTTQSAWGCPVGCHYCAYPVTQGKAVRARSARSVVAEFKLLRRRYAPRFVLFRDPFFTLERARTLELCAALEAAGTPLLWGCETRLEALDEELVERMAAAGCIRVMFGVESATPALVRGVGRAPISPARLRAQVALLKRHGMLTYAFYILGLPGETEASARATIDLALALGTDAASFSAATPFPGTPLAESAAALVRAGDRLHLTSSVPSMSSGALDPAAVARLRLEAKERWAQRKRPAAPASR